MDEARVFSWVTLAKIEIIESANCMACTVSIAPISAESSKLPVMSRHLLYDVWPDNGVPTPEFGLSLL